MLSTRGGRGLSRLRSRDLHPRKARGGLPSPGMTGTFRKGPLLSRDCTNASPLLLFACFALTFFLSFLLKKFPTSFRRLLWLTESQRGEKEAEVLALHFVDRETKARSG